VRGRRPAPRYGANAAVEKAEGADGVIRFHDVGKRFGKLAAVDGLVLSIGAGEVVALLGPNGSGKTTTLKMAAGLVKPDTGRVTIGDPPLDAGDPRARRSLSFLPFRRP
jgi:Cu-processing system ATP-binding protein